MTDKPTYEELARRVRELEKAASERSKSEAHFRMIYEQAPVGIAILDSRTGRFLHINDAFCNIVGYSRSEMLEMDYHN